MSPLLMKAVIAITLALIFYQKQCEKTPTSTGSEMNHTPIVS